MSEVNGDIGMAFAIRFLEAHAASFHVNQRTFAEGPKKGKLKTSLEDFEDINDAMAFIGGVCDIESIKGKTVQLCGTLRMERLGGNAVLDMQLWMHDEEFGLVPHQTITFIELDEQVKEFALDLTVQRENQFKDWVSDKNSREFFEHMLAIEGEVVITADFVVE